MFLKSIFSLWEQRIDTSCSRDRQRAAFEALTSREKMSSVHSLPKLLQTAEEKVLNDKTKGMNLEKLSKPPWMSNLCRLVELLTNLHAYKLLQQMVSRRQHAHSAIANPFNLIFM